MEQGILEQLDEIKMQQETVKTQRKILAEEKLILQVEVELFEHMKRDLLRDVEKKIWQMVDFFIKVWKLKY